MGAVFAVFGRCLGTVSLTPASVLLVLLLWESTLPVEAGPVTVRSSCLFDRPLLSTLPDRLLPLPCRDMWSLSFDLLLLFFDFFFDLSATQGAHINVHYPGGYNSRCASCAVNGGHLQLSTRWRHTALLP